MCWGAAPDDSSDTKTIRALLVDDHTICRTGLRQLLAHEPDIRATTQAPDIAKMPGLLRRDEVNAALLAVNMSGRSGLRAMPSIRADFPQLLVLLPLLPYFMAGLKAASHTWPSGS